VLKIMVVDDDCMVGKCLMTMIDWKTLEYDFVGIANNGLQAYDMIKDNKIDVVITDFKMPIMDGLELCKIIRENLENVTIILLSAYEDFYAAQVGIKYNVRNYILKPLDEAKLDEITKILEDIRDQHMNEQYCQYLLSGHELEIDVAINLESGNKKFYEELFYELNNMFIGSNSLLEVVCLKLINCLYEYLKSIGFDEQVVEKKQTTVNDLVKEIKGSVKIVDFTQMMYTNVLYLIPNKASSYGELIPSMMRYINENCSNNDMYYPMIATEFKISQQHMRRIFKEKVGMTLNEYITSIRLTKAAELLSAEDIMVQDVARRVGFTYSSSFMRSFKKRFGVTPNEYRNN